MKETVEKILIEENGVGGFDSYRVPGIITSSNGDLLLTYEGRRGNGNERALFLRRCRLGRNEKWTEKTEENRRGIGDPTERADKNIANTHQYIQIGERSVMAEQKTGELLHNPLLIAGPSGHVWFFWCQDYGRLFLRESADHGASFGPVRELTAAIDGFRRDWPVTLWSIAPGHGICMKDGTVVLPLWLSRGENAHFQPASPACSAGTRGKHGSVAASCRPGMEWAILRRPLWPSVWTERCWLRCAMRSGAAGSERFVREARLDGDRHG